jgi:hypothetical protein
MNSLINHSSKLDMVRADLSYTQMYGRKNVLAHAMNKRIDLCLDMEAKTMDLNNSIGLCFSPGKRVGPGQSALEKHRSHNGSRCTTGRNRAFSALQGHSWGNLATKWEVPTLGDHRDRVVILKRDFSAISVDSWVSHKASGAGALVIRAVLSEWCRPATAVRWGTAILLICRLGESSVGQDCA